MAERSTFRNRLQKDNETIIEYITKLQKFSITYNFGNNLEEVLRNQLVHGIKELTLKKKLCEESNLTYEKLKEICQAHEGAERRLQNFPQLEKEQRNIHFMHKKSNRNNRPKDQRQGYEKGGDSGVSSESCSCCGKINYLFIVILGTVVVRYVGKKNI